MIVDLLRVHLAAKLGLRLGQRRPSLGELSNRDLDTYFKENPN